MTQILSNPLPNAPRPIAFSVIRVPFFLEPHYDETKPFIETNRQRLIQKWGGRQGWEQQKKAHNLKGRGLDAGIPHFNLDRLTSNTMASHRLIQYIGKTYGLAASEDIYDLLNQYYFVDGYALNDRPRLAKTVADRLSAILSVGAPTQQELLNFLNGREGRKEIEDALAALTRLGVHGIPKFIIQGSTIVDGAARSNAFVDIFRKIERRGEIDSGPMFADILGLPSDVIQNGSHRPEHFAA